MTNNYFATNCYWFTVLVCCAVFIVFGVDQWNAVNLINRWKPDIIK